MNITTMMESSIPEDRVGDLPGKQSRAQELRHARKILEGLAARSENTTNMKEFTHVLGSVMDVLQRLEMEDNADDSGTAATVPETVVSATTDEMDDDACHNDDDSLSYSDDEQTRKVVPRSVRKHKRRPLVDPLDDIIDESDFSQGLEGYVEGFYPPHLTFDCEESYNNEPVTGSIASAGFGTPKTRRSRTTASVSEESQCFYCATHGNEGSCSGSRFCC